MQLGMIGLGRMGANMVRRLLRHGHQCVVFDVSPDAVAQLVKDKATGSSSLGDFVKKLEKPRADLADGARGGRRQVYPRSVAAPGGGRHSDRWRQFHHIDDIRRSKEMAPKGIHYVDVGTSGGVRGLERGYCMMIGGPEFGVRRLDPIF